ncbi:MAG TPA: ferrous iron transport protein B [Candidatus Omnitrophota bacterium]|nr:ferrous iron transport protein B [Candidatus Omnitrophota bacterium]
MSWAGFKKVRELKTGKIAIVGAPNVGKSVLFNDLTGSYVTVSNYPGTTVEILRGRAKIGGSEFEVIDTPGMYSLIPLSEEEGVAREILINESIDLIVHVIDAKNLERMLPLTFELLEATPGVVLVLNMMDEARASGVSIDHCLLEEMLGIPVIPAVSISGEGIDRLKEIIAKRFRSGFSPSRQASPIVRYSFEDDLRELESLIPKERHVSSRCLALWLLKGDEEIRARISLVAPDAVRRAEAIRSDRACFRGRIPEYEIAAEQRTVTRRIASQVFEMEGEGGGRFFHWDRYLMKPVTGIPILLLVLYFGLYQFVGRLGAGTLVGFIEGTVFEKYLNPFFVSVSARLIPWESLRDLLTGEYGMITLGLRYAIALILPIVTLFFLVFSVLEDSGYLPRLAMLLDRAFKKIGLSGRAVIPMVLGLGCDTMATMVTRTLPTKRERVISTVLLALAVPCSAQLGVIFALLSRHPEALAVWAAVIGGVFFVTGFFSACLLPGERASFYMELPPLRAPKLSNILVKTFARVKWYLEEVIPLFLLASFLIWIGRLTHTFDFTIAALEKPVSWLGLPPESASAFLFGFFRRDYGVAGLYDLSREGILNGNQVLIACVALTLFLPCIAQFLMNIKERGWKTATAISVFVLFFSFGIAYGLNWVLLKAGVSL